MLDYLLCAPDEATAIADATLGAFHRPASADDPGGWREDVVNIGPERTGLSVWADSGDVTLGTDPTTGQPIIQHTYLPGFWLSISQTSRNAALEASPYLVLGSDRDMANAGATMAQFVIVFGPNQNLTRFTGMHVSPVEQGANYPFQ
jgi:hypothetical protein